MMETKVLIPVPRRSQSQWLCLFVLLWPFALGALPHGAGYLLDVAWLGMLLYLVRFYRLVDWRDVWKFAWVILLFFLCTALVYPVQYQSALYYLWGLRNNFRFYVAFLAFGIFLTQEEIGRWEGLLDGLFWINAAVSAVQYLFLDLRGDHLGGIFGRVSGVNGDTNIFFLVVLTASLVRYLEKRERGSLCGAKFAVAVVIAALAEIKFFFVELPLLLCLSVLVTDFSWRKLWVILGGALAVVLGAVLLTAAFPQNLGWYSPWQMLQAAASHRGYTSAGDLNRLTAIPRIDELWLKHWSQRIFGKGLGNCDTASFGFLNTPFYRSYGHMHYTWISYAFIYLETGWVGLLFYWGFFLLVAAEACRRGRKETGARRTRCRSAMILAIFCLLLSVYNASLRAESAYILYFALAAPFAAGKEKGGSCENTVLG